MIRKLLFVIAFFSIYASALDRMWDARYTFGPEIRSYSKMGFGVGLRSGFNTDVTMPLNFQARLGKDIGFGAKLFFISSDKLESVEGNIDVGAKFNLSTNSYVGIDGCFALNRNNGGGLVFTYSKLTPVASSFSNIYEVRAGFLEGITGPNGYVKLQVGVMPTLQLGDQFTAMVEMNSSGSVGNVKDDFMVDLLPKLELRLSNVRLRLEVDIGILLKKNNDQKKIALYALTTL